MCMGRREVLDRGGAGQTRHGPSGHMRAVNSMANMSVTSPLQGCRQGGNKVQFAHFKALPEVWIMDWRVARVEWNL